MNEFDDPRNSAENNQPEKPEEKETKTNEPDGNVAEQEGQPDVYVPAKKTRTVSMRSFLVSVVAVFVAAVLLTVSICSQVYQRKLIDAKNDSYNQGTSDTGATDLAGVSKQLATLDSLFSQLYYDYDDIDKEALGVALLKAYVEATGDLYAEYYTAEEFAEMSAENNGDMEGIGVSVIYTNLEINGVEYGVMQIIAVYENTPAAKAGVQVGDCIAYVGEGEDHVLVQTAGYTKAVAKLRGKAGTTASFTVLRKNEKNEYEEVSFNIVREHFTTQSVSGRVLDADSSVGVVRIMQFDLTTPTQFSAIMDELKEKGCKYFVFDVRNNPGGDLKSIEAVLSFFLSEGDLLVSTEDKYGNSSKDVVKVYTGTGDYAGCSVKKSDIGKYRGTPCVVLTNGNTASAAELFTQTMRDYNLAKIVGTKTYGKGCMQSIFTLERYGIPGALKLTTRMYFSKSHHVYHGIGIEPDETVELSEEALKYNVFVLPDELDDQLQKALQILK